MDQRTRRIGSIAGATLAAVVALGGCSSDSDSDSKKKSTASASPAADEKKPDSDASASSPASAADQSTPEGAVAAWVTAVIKQQPKEACLVMAEPAKGSTPAKVGSEETCGDDAPDRKQIDATVEQLGESFTPEPPPADPKVEVAKAEATGDTVEYPADKITVDGQTLEKIVLSHSTGVTADQLNIKVQSGRIEDSWYVTNLDLDIG
ncbi:MULTISPECIES: hypothetical protein [unclassified Streptomyces]|uniref:hypothetical protein n=1 Tax=Streptomyces sp. NPDC059517 TaxID=3346855 RepID=UPI0036828786